MSERIVVREGDQALSRGTVCPPEEGKTRQSEAKSADINVIVATYDKTGVLPPLREGFFADVSNISDYRTALETVRAAEATFMQLPAGVRAKFDNNPAVLLDAWNNEDATFTDVFKELGWLKEKEVVPSPVAAPSGAGT